MSHRKISKAARRALLARFPPDGYVLVDAMDQTIGFWDGEDFTTRHPEALVFKTKEQAEQARAAHLAEWEAHVHTLAETETDPAARARWQSVIERQPWKAAPNEAPWIEAVQVERHFRDRPDTW